MVDRPGSGSRGFLSGWLGRLYIAAVAMGSLAFAVWLFTFIGSGGYTWRIGVIVAEARFSAPDRLVLSSIGVCGKNPEVSRLVETDADVQVAMVADATPFLFGLDCGQPVGLRLQEPLEDRDVVDKRTGRVVRDASSYTGVNVVEARLRAPSVLFLYAGTCDEYPEVSRFVETGVDVQVKVVAYSHTSSLDGQDCRTHRLPVPLQEPLGERDIVDMHTGKVVNLQSWEEP